MSKDRRQFLASSAGALALGAASYDRVLGANDRLTLRTSRCGWDGNFAGMQRPARSWTTQKRIGC
ncbi:MAG TPA: hypothetical protein VHR72_13115 [Gemmataceae bacterium]|jgi:hypothetical protein|nr:hypothetical protein [Gemmataceae bacterium]